MAIPYKLGRNNLPANSFHLFPSFSNHLFPNQKILGEMAVFGMLIASGYD
jgi:hypothetical protein